MLGQAGFAAERALTASVVKRIGSITVGIGVVSCVWDGYQISKALDGSMDGATTKLGEALRRIVREEYNIRTQQRVEG